MKIFLLSVLTIGLISLPAMAQDTSDTAAKMDLAKKYSTLAPLQDAINKSIEELVLQVPMDNRVLLKSTLERNIKIDQLESVSEMAMVDVFTLNELEALVAFYETPEGRAIKDKMPLYQSRLEPIITQMIRDAVESYDNQVK